MSAYSKKGKIESNLNIQLTTKKATMQSLNMQCKSIVLNEIVHEMKVNCSLERVVSQGERARTIP